MFTSDRSTAMNTLSNVRWPRIYTEELNGENQTFLLHLMNACFIGPFVGAFASCMSSAQQLGSYAVGSTNEIREGLRGLRVDAESAIASTLAMGTSLANMRAKDQCRQPPLHRLSM